MPTLICIDTSLSLQRKIGQDTLISLTLKTLATFIHNVIKRNPHELIEIATISDSYKTMVI